MGTETGEKLKVKNGHERCIPSDLHPPRSSIPPHLPLEGKTYMLKCLLFGLSSAPRVYKTVEASSGTAEAEWSLANNICI